MTDPNVNQIEQAANAVETELEANAATIAADAASIQQLQEEEAADRQTIQADEAKIEQLQAEVTQLTPKPVVVISGIQNAMPEKAADGSVGLWYEARSASAPKTGPHGSIVYTPGEPAVQDFHPVALAGGFSDNVYLLHRLYPTLTAEQKEILEKATEFSIGCKVSLQPRANSQAYELDYQIRKSDGIVINVGGQLLPDGTLRAFDYVKKDWVALGPKIDLSFMDSFEYPVEFTVFATCDGITVQFTKVRVNGQEFPVTVSHPVTKTTVLDNPYCNAANQLDAQKTAPAYKAIVGELTITFS